MPDRLLPILIPLTDYKKLPDEAIVKKYENDGITNILFIGRIAPNKKQEDVIAAFAYYHKFMNRKSRLFIVGCDSGMEIYANPALAGLSISHSMHLRHYADRRSERLPVPQWFLSQESSCG